MSATFIETITLRKIECGSCGGVWAISQRVFDYAYENGGGYRCPYCPAEYKWRETEADRLRKALEAKGAELQRAQQQSANDRTARIAAEDRAAKDKRKVKRTEAGVCPHCNRQFRALCRHMATKHGIKNGEPAQPKK